MRIIYFKIKNKKCFLHIICLLIVLITLCLSSLYQSYKYNNLLNTFKENFDQYRFSEANNLILTKENLNPFKIILVNKDILNYFNDKIIMLSVDIQNNNISPEDVLIQLKEIDHYNIISSDKLHIIANSINLIKDSSKNYNDGIESYNNENYLEAITSFKKVSSLDLLYSNSLIYINNSKDRYKESLFSSCDDLVKSDRYNQALSLISNKNIILNNDVSVKEKILEIKGKQQEYLDKNSQIAEASSSALTSTISINNINNLNIESSTSYFINVNLADQKTFIYKGTADKWQLIKTFSCSTGILGEETPSGSFSSKEKGEWFFSNKYEQGGKYWTQITGDILFHSLPFANDKSTILDYTLNKPSSHGCIRLSIEDAKWIYNNIPKGTKIIIK